MPKNRTDLPWERQNGESAQAFAAFLVYLNLGAERSHQTVSQQCGKSISLIGRWSRAYGWVERCRAWDNHIQYEAKKAAITEVRNMTKRHVTMAQQIQNAAMRALKELGSDMVNPKNFAAIVKLATELERQNLEAQVTAASEEISSTQDDGPSTLADAINEAWRRRSEENEP